MKAGASAVHLESMMVAKWAAKREALRADCSVYLLAAGWELLWAEQMADRKGGSSVEDWASNWAALWEKRMAVHWDAQRVEHSAEQLGEQMVAHLACHWVVAKDCSLVDLWVDWWVASTALKMADWKAASMDDQRVDVRVCQ
jgi:hypothetical protein